MRNLLTLSALLVVQTACGSGEWGLAIPKLPAHAGVPIQMQVDQVKELAWGDCWVLAPVISLLTVRPGYLESHFLLDGDLLSVGLWNNAGAFWYTINLGPSIGDCDGGEIPWQAALESAMDMDGYPDTNDLGGLPSQAFFALTGSEQMNGQELDEIEDSQLLDLISAATIHPTTIQSNLHVSGNTIVPNHAYSVAGWYNGCAYLTNPWGIDNVCLSTKELRANFYLLVQLP